MSPAAAAPFPRFRVLDVFLTGARPADAVGARGLRLYGFPLLRVFARSGAGRASRRGFRFQTPYRSVSSR